MTTPQTAQVFRLICDFALGPLGDLQGLTPAELRRAFIARHGVVPSRRAHELLSEGRLVVRIAPRRCEVAGQFRAPYVPAVQAGNEIGIIKFKGAVNA